MMVEWIRWHNDFCRAVQLGNKNLNNLILTNYDASAC